MRNVTLKLLDACGRSDLEAVAALLPVVATLLQFRAPDFKRLSDQLVDAAARAKRERELAERAAFGSLTFGGYTLRL